MKTHDKSHIKQQKLLDWLYYQLKNLGGGSGTTTAAVTYPVENAYPDQASMLADQVNQTINYFQYQIDTDTYYEYLGTTNAAIGDYRELTADETLIINGKTLAPISKIYADATAMYADQKKQLGGFIYRTLDDDVYFGYLGTRNGDATDYIPFGGSLSGYVPYTGATANVALGAYDIRATKATFDGFVSTMSWLTTNSYLNIKSIAKVDPTGSFVLSHSSGNQLIANYTGLKAEPAAFSIQSYTSGMRTLKFDTSLIGLEATSTLTVPDKSGTIALTGDIALDYVPYTGATASLNMNNKAITSVSQFSTSAATIGGTLLVNAAGNFRISHYTNNTITANQTTIYPTEYKFTISSANASFTDKAIQFDYSGVQNVVAIVLKIPNKAGTIASINTTAPANATDTGVVGEIRVTSTFIYTCIATNTWVRAAVATW